VESGDGGGCAVAWQRPALVMAKVEDRCEATYGGGCASARVCV
jgi:hypothetical protein